MKRLILISCAALGLAQSGPDAVNRGRLYADLQFLCSQELQGRLSLSPEAAMAARYIASAFQKAGLAPAGKGYLQEFPLIAYDPDRSRTHLSVGRRGKTTEFQFGQDFRGGYWQDLKIHAPVVFAGYGITAPEYQYDDYKGINAEGKVVLVFDHEPQETDAHSVFNGTGHSRHGNSRVKVENARRHGAVAVLLVSDPLRKHAGAFDPTPRTLTATPLRANAPRQAIEEDSIPLFQVDDGIAAELLKASGKMAAPIAKAIDAGLKPQSQALANTTVDITTAASNARHETSFNAVGLLEGSDAALKGETVMITAHYDHLGVHTGQVYPGANDNASGTVAVMELARLFAAGTRPKRSLLFVVFGSEEEGMLGSNYYVEHPLRPLETTRAVLNLDMIARDEAHIPQSEGVVQIPADTKNEINLVGVSYSPELEAVIQKANQKTGLELSTKFDRDHDMNALFRCDHFPFLVHNVPAAWFFGGWHPGYHEPSDTVEQINFPKLEKVIRLAFGTAQSVGDTAQPPRFRP